MHAAEEEEVVGVCTLGRSKCGRPDWLSWVEEDQTSREVLLDYTWLVWAQDFLAFCCRTWFCGIADQSFTQSASRNIIYTSVKSTIIEKTMKPLLHLLIQNFDQRQRFSVKDRNGPAFLAAFTTEYLSVHNPSLILFLLWVLVICFLLFTRAGSQFISWSMMNVLFNARFSMVRAVCLPSLMKYVFVE